MFISAWFKVLKIFLSHFLKNSAGQLNEIITDGTHHSSAITWRNIYLHFDNALRFGLTATPYRADNQPLGEFYTHMYEAIKMSEAIEKSYLCKLRL